MAWRAGRVKQTALQKTDKDGNVILEAILATGFFIANVVGAIEFRRRAQRQLQYGPLPWEMGGG